ncbi:MAG: polysaccharide deacetylase family protein [Ruminococcaceae bacterium]|nr:polysaccharide deacetylase family protein [Oscillospiraceae bacterium]
MVIKIRKNFVFVFVIILLFVCGFIWFEPFVTVAEEKEGIRVPIIMYHQITKKSSRKGKYTVMYSQFEEDMKYIKSKGYTTIDMTDLIDFVYGKKSLPKKPIMITFDDGFESVYAYVYPLLKEMKMCAVASIVGEYTTFFTENPDHNITYSYMDWHQIKELTQGNVIEIQNHSYDLHKNNTGRHGISKKTDENVATYNVEVGADITKMQNIMNEKTGYMPNTLTFPFGAYKNETISLSKSLGFKAALLCEERINIIKQGDTESLYHLGRYNRPSYISTEKFFENILTD